ncbi:MAG: hypothetical protein U9R25_19525 [Chloroflexota bacterium]|nr:hypothetical protein [Chloroflexota bacterium]
MPGYPRNVGPGSQASDHSGIDYVEWETNEALPCQVGALFARGNALPQIRNPDRLAAAGSEADQYELIRSTILDALDAIMTALEITVDNLDAFREELASASLVAANRELAPLGVILLDLSINEFRPWDGGPNTEES